MDKVGRAIVLMRSEKELRRLAVFKGGGKSRFYVGRVSYLRAGPQCP